MDVITTPSIKSILELLKSRLPTVNFTAGNTFAWNPILNQITYTPETPFAIERLLHESGHAICAHTDYDRDITLLEMERDAWEAARRLGRELSVDIRDDVVHEHLDEYRLWLHARSNCPNCEQVGVQDAENSYTCPICLNSWRVNDARTCQLRRYKK